MSRLRAFESPSFRLLWCSSLATAGAQLMERVATSWLALEAGGALGVGLVLAARMLPSLLFGLLMGTIADRRDRRRWLMAVALATATLALVLRTLVGSGEIALWEIASIAFLAGAVQVADTPARQALIFDSVGRATAPSAIAWNAVATRFFGAVGALAGGLAIPLLGIANCYAIVASGYLVSLALLTAIRLPVTPASAAPITHPPFARALGAAARTIVERPAVRVLVLAAMACEVFGFSYQTVVPTIARDVLRAGAEGLGVLTAASALGATLAVVLLAGLAPSDGRSPRPETLLVADYLLYRIALVGFGLAHSLALAIVAMLFVGGCAAAFDALQQILLQLAAPEDQRGRAIGIWVFSIGTAPVGNLETGALASVAGAPAALVANGLLVALGALILAVRAPTYRFGSSREKVG